ncbi:MAG: 16S rRNA (adenine(1518)-N(6)/adenine(1519)-N(6))-dimethyltransferase RsmA [Candidatus Micrarchaeota archaeon]|nr:16S rRNA (adenine(1518)-N(6)/adenine(1519)-N(6))-dimethyltransferase RsmA [Candidatus Micrarchaeota archaeon]
MRARLGQHFLADESVLDFEVMAADVRGKSVLEIGAGDGRLTRRLLLAGAESITAVELDRRYASRLRAEFGRKVEVVEGDFLSFQPKRSFSRIIGNIPYYITTPIIFKLAQMDFGKAVLCVQKEVAERMLAPPGSSSYGRLSVSSQLLFRIEPLAQVSRLAFQPVPKVDSWIIGLEKSGEGLGAEQHKALAAIFSHRKKSLKNAVIAGRRELFLSDDKGQADKIAQTLKYRDRKVFSLSPKEVLETIEELMRCPLQARRA